MNRACKLALLPAFIFLACFFGFVAGHRFIDGDEGFYVLASRLVLEHKVPYLDFFYTQAPLSPYVYGLWIKLFGISWYSARSLSAVLTTILGLLIYEHICHETRRWTGGLAAIALFASSTFVFAYFPLVKTFSLAALFLFVTYVIVIRLSPSSPWWLVALAGLSFGLSVDSRSYIIGLAPVFLWWIFRYSEKRDGVACILWFTGGFTIGIAGSVFLFFASPHLFLFNNIGYHAIRTDAGLIGDWRAKMYTARELLLGSRYNGIQFSIMSTVSLAAIVVRRTSKRATLLAFLIAFVLGFISILPTPPFVQYFSLCMPFLIAAAICGASDYITSLPTGPPQRIATFVGVAMLVLFVASAGPSFKRYLVTGEKVDGIKGASDAPNWTLDSVTAVSQTIDELAAPKEEIASFWPGYIFASKAEPYPGFENNFGRLISQKLTADQRAEYHIVDEAAIETGFAAHRPRIVVLGNLTLGAKWDVCDDPLRASACAQILLSNGYTAVRTIGDTSIYVCCSRQ